MENIYEVNETFDFNKLTLAYPSSIQGNAYFTKIEYNKNPLYIQTSKSKTKQGIIKSGKKYYCDLMFNKNDVVIINWFEKLEEKCKKLIFSKKSEWFQNDLEEDDIDNSFSPTIKIYKSGKNYLIRSNIENLNNIPSIKIFDEKKVSLNIDDINTETNIISILEIEGIKFTSSFFQIEINIKQVMVLNDDLLFDNCLIRSNKSILKDNDISSNLSNTNNLTTFNETSKFLNNNIPFTEKIVSLETLEPLVPLVPLVSLETLETLEPLEPLVSLDILKKNKENKKEENILLKIDIQENMNGEIQEIMNEDIQENVDELKEITNFEIALDNNLETISLKKPNQVYFELYTEAKNKAKNAKKNKILSYLEAKNIKNTYMLDNLIESDFDNEIDEVSESELDDL